MNCRIAKYDAIFCFTKTSLKLAINSQVLFDFGSMCFCQLITIPMIKPHLWKPYSFVIMKGKQTNKQKKQKLQKSSTFSNIFRFVDDLCTFNDEFEITYTDIYPDELGQKVYEDTCKDSSLDISLDVIDRAFTSKLIDNTYAFPVYINHKHYSDSSILSKIFYTCHL